MARVDTEYVCSKCGYRSPKWLGRCPSCSEWETMSAEDKKTSKGRTGKPGGRGAEPIPIGNVESPASKVIPTGIAEFDRTLGGGIISDATLLISGDPGIGKSTLILHVMSNLSARGFKCLYVTGEESPSQIRSRASRLKALTDNLFVLSETDTEAIANVIEEFKPDMVAIDSIQTLSATRQDSLPGSLSQVRESASLLIQLAKERGICIFFIGHVTKDGQIAGPMTLEHMVDTVIYFEGDKRSHYRILRANKNRFGSTNEIGIFEMTEAGLMEIKNPSNVFLGETTEKSPGSIILSAVEGTRPIFVEIQALCANSSYSVPTRISTGADRNRVLLLAAIIEKKLGLNLSNQDIYINVTGGFRITERGSDLAIASAIISSLTNKIMPKKSFVFGEIGLTGEIRSSGYPEKRISEGEKLGFESCLLPAETLKTIKNRNSRMELIGLDYIHEIMDKVF